MAISVRRARARYMTMIPGLDRGPCKIASKAGNLDYIVRERG
jgi:hypothetical protein